MTKRTLAKDIRERLEWHIERNDKRVERLTRRLYLLTTIFVTFTIALLAVLASWQPSFLELRLTLSYTLFWGALLFLALGAISVTTSPERTRLSFRMSIRMPYISLPSGLMLVAFAVILLLVLPPFPDWKSTMAASISMFLYVLLGSAFIFRSRWRFHSSLEKEYEEAVVQRKNRLMFFFIAVLIVIPWLINSTLIAGFWSSYVHTSATNLGETNLLLFLMVYTSTGALVAASLRSGHEQLTEQYERLLKSKLSPRKIERRFRDLLTRQEELTVPTPRLFLLHGAAQSDDDQSTR